MKELDHENIRIATPKVADMLEISFWSVQSILEGSLKMCQISTKSVPCLLSEKENCVGLQGRLACDPEFLLKIITVDKTCI